VHEVARQRRRLAGAVLHLACERLRSEATALVEVQTPSAVRATLQKCVRLVYSEFGPFRDKHIRRSDLLWVPSRYVAERARVAFPENDILLVPLGIDPEIFHPAGERLPSLAPGPFRFLYVGTTISRKGFDLLLEAYAAEQPHMPGAELVLKLQPTWQGFLHELPECSLPGVRVIREPASAKAMAALYRSCDVLVAPSRAESFHMGVLEAMACGRPAIVPDGSAMDDFCPVEARYSLAADEVEVEWTKGRILRFLEPDPMSLREAMRAAHDDRTLCAAKGEAAANAARFYTWSNVMRLLLARI
jgi:glycosyltransferase involved in cell wall biosynthesis